MHVSKLGASSLEKSVVLQAKQDKSVGAKQDRLMRGGIVEEQDGEFSFCGRCEEDGMIAVWVDATGNGCAWRTINTQALRS